MVNDLKHAYLIMAHNNFYILEKLLELLDYEKNDIFIHIDRKVKDCDFEKFNQICKKSNVFFTKRRHNVKWGTSSQIKTELELFKTSVNKKYKYYHLISGVDLPLKSQDYIHGICDTINKNFMWIATDGRDENTDRLKYFHTGYHGKNRAVNKINRLFMGLQNKLKVDRFKKTGMIYKQGANWCSVTNDFVEYLLKNEKMIRKMVFASSCADECYKQTLIWNSNLKETLYNEGSGYCDFRYITKFTSDWHPHIYLKEDYNDLINTNCWFARKFDVITDKEIVDMIYSYVKDK